MEPPLSKSDLLGPLDHCREPVPELGVLGSRRGPGTMTGQLCTLTLCQGMPARPHTHTHRDTGAGQLGTHKGSLHTLPLIWRHPAAVSGCIWLPSTPPPGFTDGDGTRGKGPLASLSLCAFLSHKEPQSRPAHLTGHCEKQ